MFYFCNSFFCYTKLYANGKKKDPTVSHLLFGLGQRYGLQSASAKSCKPSELFNDYWITALSYAYQGQVVRWTGPEYISRISFLDIIYHQVVWLVVSFIAIKFESCRYNGGIASWSSRNPPKPETTVPKLSNCKTIKHNHKLRT